MLVHVVRVCLASAVCLVLAAPAAAQSAATNADTLRKLARTLDAYGVNLSPVIELAIVNQLATLPEPGPATTLGRGRFRIGLQQHYIPWNSIDGINLKNGEMTSEVSDGAAPATLTLDYTSHIISGFVNAGITDRIEIGVVIPFVMAGVSGDATYTGTGSSSANGIGDIAATVKVGVWSSEDGAVAIAGQWLLPTGDEENLLGTGHLRTRVSLLASATKNGLTPFVNAGYAWGGGGVFDPSTLDRDFPMVFEPGKEINVTAGAYHQAHERVTIGGEVALRQLFTSARLERRSETLISPVRIIDFKMMRAAAGAKVRIGKQCLVTGHLLFPLMEAGLNSGISARFGLALIR